MNKRIIFLFALLLGLATEGVHAQWAVGIKGGVNNTSVERSNAGRIDETYSSLRGFDLGIQAHYSFNDWLVLRVDLDYMTRSHRMDRNLTLVNSLFMEYSNSYLMLPVLADFSFGGSKLRGHLLCGGFAGYWLTAHRKGVTFGITGFLDVDEDLEFNDDTQRLTAGLAAGVSLSYDINSWLGVNLDALYYYDLVSYRKGYEHLNDPRYLSTLTFDLGVYYKF
ncbi:MAG: PorT family protein [Bacteroidales bacterium]|nr:PorT family protein [Bacteroidales bacterium]